MQVQPIINFGKNGHPFLGQIKNCLHCEKEFYAPRWLDKRNGAKYCSKTCYWRNKHDEPWNKGIKGSIKPNRTSFKPLGMSFKGTIVQYKALHSKINRLFGKPSCCENCGKTGLSGKQIHWANKTGKYLLDRNDWVRLCARCHFVYDYRQHVGVDYASNIL